MYFRLSVFISVARHLNYTKASKELHISQPAITRHIQELEATYGVQLFERSGNSITLTKAGHIFLKHAESIIENFRALEFDMNLLSGNYAGTLRIGASTTIAQYVLPAIVAKFISRFPDIRFTMLTGNSEQIEAAVEEHKIDLGLVEGNSRKHNLKYTLFAKDELVLVTNTKNKTKSEISVDELADLPLVLREHGSGTLDVIENAMSNHKKKLSQLNILLQLGSTESIKSFLLNYPSAYAIISIAALHKELIDNKLTVIEIENLELAREFTFILPQGTKHDLAEKFMQFAGKSYNNKL